MSSLHKGPKKLKYGNAANAGTARGQYVTDSLQGAKKKKRKYASEAGNNNKIWMAALAGASAGVIAGLLMAPESGKSTLDSLKKNAMRLGDQMDETFRMAMNKLENMGLTRAGDSLQIQGSWDQVKGKMKAKYGELTDQDLAYLEGQEDKFLGNLETKLGKSKRELIQWINSLA